MKHTSSANTQTFVRFLGFFFYNNNLITILYFIFYVTYWKKYILSNSFIFDLISIRSILKNLLQMTNFNYDLIDKLICFSFSNYQYINRHSLRWTEISEVLPFAEQEKFSFSVDIYTIFLSGA